MSADNGIYITEWADGFQVNHGQESQMSAIDAYYVNSDEWCEIQPKLDDYEARLFKTEKEAFDYALNLLGETPICEYGICRLPGNRGTDGVPFPAVLSRYISTYITRAVDLIVLRV